MSLSPNQVLLEAALDRLERMELRVLVWGLVDSALSHDELEGALRDVLNGHQEVLMDARCSVDTENALRELLLSTSCLVSVPGRPGAAPRYRTRMAEGVRLFARLRQLFPGRHDGANWVGGATLVADYRLLWRQRRYPARDLSPGVSLDSIAARVAHPQLMAAVKTWFDAGEASWKFARFQIDAAARILEALAARTPRGTLVSAGTGSGKTLAFYLPALSWLASERRAAPDRGGVRVLALYPRNELLKDQLAEVYEQARKFDAFVGGVGSALSVGVLYADTPYSLKSAAKTWSDTKGACPFFRCPKPQCGGALYVEDTQSDESQGRLRCRNCKAVVESRHLRFTRSAMINDPPDVLFTSVEMLNQRMSDSQMRHLFGLGPRAKRVPSLMLLDEVHLYTGAYGAQVAHLLRRWSHLSRRQTQFVGLSATIADGAAFFASLVGLDRSVVEEIAPAHEHMVSEGAEYMLALRGDPVSQTALLSTSIQALLLASRLLDRRERFSSGAQPFSGWRTFAFADQLDATNRLFFDLRDAEGRTERGIPAMRRHPNGGLALLRRESPDLRRYEGGQDWRALEANGHDLATRHQVERTTALDSGVNHDAEIVVATAALEVGYDDPAVGVVLQHKAPRDMAQFLQRKGRAGRTRHMRPWTIMVLSDYGRDRLAYQTYEQYFDPELPPRELPLANRYVRRMQATYALIDYLGRVMENGEPKGSVWRDLSRPSDSKFDGWSGPMIAQVKGLDEDFPLSAARWAAIRRKATNGAPGADRYAGANWLQSHIRRKFIVARLKEIVASPDRTEELARHLGHSLGLSREEVDILLWEHPRPLLLTVVPTALRRLVTNWRAHGVRQADRKGSHPLQEFIPGTLFSDLALPEVQLLGSSYADALPVLQAMGELAPGKVSRRLDKALWIGLPADELASDIESNVRVRDVDVAAWYDLEPQFTFSHIVDGRSCSSAAWRPYAVRLTELPQQPKLRDSSNARVVWRSQVFSSRTGQSFDAPGQRVGIARLVSRVSVHTHASQSAATARRYAVASNVALRVKSGNKTIDYNAQWRFTKDGQPCGVGFEIEVDAICLHMTLPESPSTTLVTGEPAVVRAARTARFQWEAVYGSVLSEATGNVFLRGWLAQIYKVAAVALAQEDGTSLADAIVRLRAPEEVDNLRAVLVTIFQSPDAPDDDDHANQGNEPRLRAKLSDLLANDTVLGSLADLAMRTLVAPIDEDWDTWLRKAQMHTFAAAVMDAIQQACPQVDPDELIVDTDPGPSDSGERRAAQELWISEANPGGNGLIEQVVEAIATQPEQFYRRVEAALGPSEFEQIDIQLRDYVEHIGGESRDPAWEEITRSVRAASSTADAQAQLLQLRKFLASRGHAVFHGYISALSNRLLRPNSPSEFDDILAEMQTRWSELESRLGVEVDARVVCAVFSRDGRIDAAFTEAGFTPPTDQVETWRYSVLLGVLWARGHAVRSHSLPLAERFSDTPMITDRLLLSPWLSEASPPVPAAAVDLQEQLHRQLQEKGRVSVEVPPDSELLHRVIRFAAVMPVQLEYLNVYPLLTSAVRTQGTVTLHFELEATL